MSENKLWPVLGDEWRGMGNNPPSISLKLGSTQPLPDIPESEWQEFDYTKDPSFPVKIKDQGQFKACDGHAAATSLEVARWIAGLPHLDLSAWFIYANLCRGWDTGASIADALQFLESRGVCNDASVPYGTIRPSQIKPVATTEATKHRIEIGYTLTSFRDLCISAQLRQPFNFSMPVNTGFNSLDKNGCPSNISGEHNHAGCGGLGMKRVNGKWYFLFPNSWGNRWGHNGYAWIGEKNLEGWGFDAYSVIATREDTAGGPPAMK
jgi:hypothetical protein